MSPTEATWDHLQDAIEDALDVKGDPLEHRARELIVNKADAEIDEAAQALLDAWKIDGTRTAEWAMRKLRAARARIDDTEELARAEYDAIDAWVTRQTARAVHDIDYFERKIGEFHRELLAAEPRRKTLELPGGVSKITAGGLSLEIENEDAAIQDLEDLLDNPGDAVAYAASIRKAEVKKLFGAKAGKEPGDYPVVDEASGTMISGLKIRRGEPGHKVTPTPRTTGED